MPLPHTRDAAWPRPTIDTPPCASSPSMRGAGPAEIALRHRRRDIALSSRTGIHGGAARRPIAVRSHHRAAAMIVDAGWLGLINGIEAPRKAAGRQTIGSSAPVSVTLLFSAD